MNITVKRYDPYKTILIQDNGATIDSGFLDKLERLHTAKQMIEAAANLLCHDDKTVCNELIDIFNTL